MKFKKIGLLLCFSSLISACPVHFKHTCKEQKPFFQSASSVSLTPPTLNTELQKESV